jgi:Protein of unknown function (DUF3379)
MNCAEARLLIGADPHGIDASLAAHLAECESCRGYQREMQALDRDLRHVLDRYPAGDANAGATRAPPRRMRGQRLRQNPSLWALAASVVVLAGATLIWTLHPSPTLAAEVVAHVAAEPQSWSSREHPSPAELAAILQSAGVVLDESGQVSYARRCWFHGHYVPHLVVRTAQGPFTVMILPERTLRRPERFQEAGYSGELLPAPGGTLAVLGLDGDAAALDRVSAQVSRSVHWRT